MKGRTREYVGYEGRGVGRWQYLGSCAHSTIPTSFRPGDPAVDSSAVDASVATPFGSGQSSEGRIERDDWHSSLCSPGKRVSQRRGRATSPRVSCTLGRAPGCRTLRLEWASAVCQSEEGRRHAGCGAAWLARLTGGQEVPGSNPGSPTRKRRSERCRSRAPSTTSGRGHRLGIFRMRRALWMRGHAPGKGGQMDSSVKEVPKSDRQTGTGTSDAPDRIAAMRSAESIARSVVTWL